MKKFLFLAQSSDDLARRAVQLLVHAGHEGGHFHKDDLLPYGAVPLFTAPTNARLVNRCVRFVNPEKDVSERGMVIPPWAQHAKHMVALRQLPGHEMRFSEAVVGIPPRLVLRVAAEEAARKTAA